MNGYGGLSALPPQTAAGKGPAPIYVVCSPNRQVGKTLLARLLAEHYAADSRPLAVHDLSDEAPGLRDFLGSTRVTVPNIHDIRGQMALFDGLIEDNKVPKLIDLSHREFVHFFGTVDRIGLFEEATRRRIEPVILFMVDRTQVAADSYALLRRRFMNTGVSLLPVRNLVVARGVRYGGAFPHASKLVVSFEITALGPSARSFVERPRFSFLNLDQPVRPYSEMPPRTHAEIDLWFRRARFQFREMELSMIHHHATLHPSGA